MDYALAEYLHKMMEQFIKSKRTSYYPVNSCLPSVRIDMTEEECDKEKQDWENILIKIREGFKAAKDVSSDSYFEIEEYPMRKDSKGKILPIEWEAVEGEGKLSRMKDIDDPEHKEKLERWNKHYEAWREERNKTFEEGMDLFKKYFFALWDQTVIFTGNRNNEINDKTGALVKELVSGLIGLVLYQVLMDFIIEGLDDDYLEKSAFKLDWKWMVK